MKKVIVCSAILAVIFASCNASKSTSSAPSPKKVDDASIPVTSSPSSEEADLGGTWELVSLISEPTPFKTLYPNTKPTIAPYGLRLNHQSFEKQDDAWLVFWSRI